MVAWTKDEDAMLRAAVGDGLPIRKINISGHSEKSIFTRINRLDLTASRLVSDNTPQSNTFALRRCLPCGKTFSSEHVGNRICSVCRPSLHHYAA